MKIVIDNNIFFSLMNPFSAASYIFFFLNSKKIFAPEFIKSEFERHKEICLFKSGLSEHEFELRQEEVEEKINFIKLSEYEDFLKKSLKAIHDSDDVDFLALAIKFNSIIWSNDSDFKKQNLIRTFTTIEMLNKLLDSEIGMKD